MRLGLAALAGHCAGILVHDGARPLVRASEIRAGMRVVRPGTAALLAAPVVDTIKVVNAEGTVTRTLDRSALWAAQTPQFAAARDLRRVHTEADRLGWPAESWDENAVEGFRDVLRALRPNVVHFHAVQGLGDETAAFARQVMPGNTEVLLRQADATHLRAGLLTLS